LHQAVTPEAYRAVSMLLCLVPYTPMLFMGQEWAAGTPFPFFTDLPGEVGRNMRENRLKEFRHYGAHYDAETLAGMPDPKDEAAFVSAKLDWAEHRRAGHAEVLSLYRECLRLRARESLFQSPPRDRWSAGRIAGHCVGLRWRHGDGDWLLLTGTAAEAALIPLEEPFLQTRPGHRWHPVLDSNEPRFGGSPAPAAWRESDCGFHLRLPGSVLLQETAVAPLP
jgi:maltooligosyltrehalose trehalohydrolase